MRYTNKLLQDYEPGKLSSMSKKEIEELYDTFRGQAKKRMKNLDDAYNKKKYTFEYHRKKNGEVVRKKVAYKQGLKSQAYEYAKKYNNSFNVKPRTRQGLMKETNDLVRFLNAKTSTVKGAQAHLVSQKEILGLKGKHVTSEDIAKLFTIMEDINDMDPAILDDRERYYEALRLIGIEQGTTSDRYKNPKKYLGAMKREYYNDPQNRRERDRVVSEYISNHPGTKFTDERLIDEAIKSHHDNFEELQVKIWKSNPAIADALAAHGITEKTHLTQGERSMWNVYYGVQLYYDRQRAAEQSKYRGNFGFRAGGN